MIVIMYVPMLLDIYMIVIMYVPMLLDISRLLQEEGFYVPEVGHGMIPHSNKSFLRPLLL